MCAGVAERPVNTNGAQDGDDLEKLASTTFVRTSGAAVKTLLDTVGQLRSLRGLDRGLADRQAELRHFVHAMMAVGAEKFEA